MGSHCCDAWNYTEPQPLHRHLHDTSLSSLAPQKTSNILYPATNSCWFIILGLLIYSITLSLDSLSVNHLCFRTGAISRVSPPVLSPCFCHEIMSESLRTHVIMCLDARHRTLKIHSSEHIFFIRISRANPSSCTLPGSHVATVQKKTL